MEGAWHAPQKPTVGFSFLASASMPAWSEISLLVHAFDSKEIPPRSMRGWTVGADLTVSIGGA